MVATMTLPPMPLPRAASSRLITAPERPAIVEESVARSVLAAALRRCDRAGLRLVVTAPAEVHTFSAGIRRFPERLIEPTAHARYDRAYRNFNRGVGRGHDPASWRLLMFDARSQVVGAITARFFCGEVGLEYVHALSLLAGYPPSFRNECHEAVTEAFARAQRHARTPAEISDWSVRGPHARLVLATLIRAMLALGVAFELPLVLVAANHERGELAHFIRWPASPLGRQDKFYLPPFVHRASGARLRLLLLDSSALGGRLCGAAVDLGVLRECCPIISAQ